MAESQFFHFKNEDEENDRRVRLVPKSPDARLEPIEGEPLEMMDLGSDGYGFCLSKFTGISCVGAQPSTKIYQIMLKSGGTIPIDGSIVLIDGVPTEQTQVPTWLVLTPLQPTPQDFIDLGLEVDGPYTIAPMSIASTSPIPHRFELQMTPANQDTTTFRTFDPMVTVVPGGFGVCLKGAPPEPVCNWARIGLVISPDLFYGDPPLIEGQQPVGSVTDVVWTVEVNGVVLPKKAQPTIGNYLEEVLSGVPGIIAKYAGAEMGPTGTFMANDTNEAIKIRLIPNKLFPRDKVNFSDIPTEEVLAGLILSPPNFTGVVPVQHGSVFMSEDGSINICLAPKGTVPPKGISCDGASPYLVMAVAINPSSTVNVEGIQMLVDDVSTGMSLPPDLFESVPIAQSGFTEAEVITFAKDVVGIPESWQVMVAGCMLSKSAQNHIVKAKLLPANQDQYKYILFSPWSNELYDDGGMGACVREGASIPRPKPFQCGSGTNTVFIKTDGFPTPTGAGFQLIENGNVVVEGETLSSFVSAVNASNVEVTVGTVGDVGFVLRNAKLLNARQLMLKVDAGFPTTNDYQFFDVPNSVDYEKLLGDDYQEVVDRLTALEPTLNTFFDENDGTIKFCLKNITPDRWWVEELNEDDEVITELDGDYLNLTLRWNMAGSPTGFDINVQIDNQAICTFNGNWTPGLLRFNIHQTVGTANITITHPQWPSLPPLKFKIIKLAPKNKVRIFKLEQNNHQLLDGDGSVVGVDTAFNLIGGVEGKHAYLSYDATYEDPTNQYGMEVDPQVVLCTSADSSVATASMVSVDDMPDLWDQAGGKYRKKQRGLIRIDFGQSGTTDITIVPKRPTFTAQTPIVYRVTTIADTPDMVMQVLPQQDKVCKIEVQGGAGVVNWGDGTTSNFSSGQQIVEHTYATLGVVQQITLNTSNPIDYLRVDNVDNVFKWPNITVKKFRFSTVMNVPSTIPTGVETLADSFRDNVYFNSVIDEWVTTGIEDYSYFAAGATSFGQNVGVWNTTAGKNFSHAFEGTALICTLHNDFSNAIDLSYMLNNASKWSGGITSRNFHKATNMDWFMAGTLIEYREAGQGGAGAYQAPWPTLAHIEVPLITVRPISFRFDDNVVSGARDDNPTDPVWGKIHTYTSECTYVQNASRAALFNQIQAVMTRYQTDESWYNDVVVMEDAQGRVIDSLRGLPQGVNHPRFLHDPKPKVETTYKVKTSGDIMLDRFVFPMSTVKVLDWASFKTKGITNLGFVESVPTSIPTWFKDLNGLFANLQGSSTYPDLQYNGTEVLTWNTENLINVSYMYQGNSRFNQPIDWKLPLVPSGGFNYMLNQASAFNQDLTHWCTTLAVGPSITDFSTGSAMQADKLPVWGTCPA